MKNNAKACICAVLAFVIALSLFGCVERFVGEDTDYSTGDILTPEMIESIFEEISVPVTEKYPSETCEDGSIILYWLENGTVWHVSLNCASITKSNPGNLHSGDISEAMSAGKERGCKICSASIEIDTPQYTETEAAISTTDIVQEKYPKDYSADGRLIVYWVKNGTVWHVSSKCSSLSKTSASDILSGSEDEALTQGKERACKICSNEN